MRVSTTVSVTLLLASPLTVARAQPTIEATRPDDTIVSFSLTPDPALIATGGDTLGVELALELSSVHEGFWDIEFNGGFALGGGLTPIPAPNPFTGGVTSGLWFDTASNVASRAFASFEADLSAYAGGPIGFLDLGFSYHLGFECDCDSVPLPPTSGFDLDYDAELTQGGVTVQHTDTLDVSRIPFPPLVEAVLQFCGGDCDVDDFGVFVNSFLLSPQGGPPYAPGDFNEDGDVDVDDFGVLVHGFQGFPGLATSTIVTSAGDAPGPIHVADFDEDGDVDVDDYGVFVNGFRQSCSFGGPPFCEQDFDQDADVDIDDFGVFGEGFQMFPPVVETPIADFDGDGFVTLDDFGVMVDSLGQVGGGPPYLNGDFDENGVVDLDDFGVFIDEFQRFPPPGAAAAAPEPGSLTLALAGLLTAARRRTHRE